MTLYFVAPEDDEPWGGIRRIYMFVDLLNAEGVGAAVVHGEEGFRCTWFEHRTRIECAEGLRLRSAADVLVIPEIYGPRLLSLAPGIPRIALVQNPYELYTSFPSGSGPGRLADAATLLGAVVVSEDSAAFLHYAFPGLAVHRVVLGVDTTIFHPGPPAGRTIAVMPRKRREDVAAVLGIVRSRGALEGWQVAEIDATTEENVARTLRSARLFLSFSSQEGFGLPPLEAMASGCLVAGFDGRGGREYFRPDLTFPVADGDVVGFARVVEALVTGLTADPAQFQDRVGQGLEFVRTEYSMGRQRDTVMAALSLLARRPGGPSCSCTLTAADVRFNPPRRRPFPRSGQQMRAAIASLPRRRPPRPPGHTTGG